MFTNRAVLLCLLFTASSLSAACGSEAEGTGDASGTELDVATEVAENDASGGDVVEPDATAPDAAEPDATDVEATDADAPSADVTEDVRIEDTTDTTADALEDGGGEDVDAGAADADADAEPDAADTADAADAGDAADVEVTPDVAPDVVADAIDTAPDVAPDVAPDAAPDVADAADVAPEGPINFDVTSVLLDDVVANNGAGALDAIHDPMDRSGYVIMTASAALAIGGTAGNGVPDDASFSAAGDRPAIQLHWRNDDDGPNGRVLLTDGAFEFFVPRRTYESIEIYALSTEGASNVDITLHYGDGSTVLLTTNFVDWFDDPAPSGFQLLIDGLDRYSSFDGAFDNRTDPAISAFRLTPDPEREVVRVVIAMKSGNQFVFFGASGW